MEYADTVLSQHGNIASYYDGYRVKQMLLFSPQINYCNHIFKLAGQVIFQIVLIVQNDFFKGPRSSHWLNERL